MKRPVQVLLYCLSCIVLLANCEDKLDHYKRPESLAKPMYQQLDSMGNFTHFLALVDKANYKRTLSNAGYWTLFAPTDAAFETYFQEKGISGVDAIDSATARGIVTFNLVYNAFSVDKLSDYQSRTGWEIDEAYKRRTAYYDGVYTAKNAVVDGQVVTEMPVISHNWHAGIPFILDDKGNKYITYFTEEYFSTHNLSAADYNYFYPNTPYVGFNVAGAKVDQANIFAENGFMHIVDKVIEPMPNVEQHLATNEEYSSFRNLLERYLTEYDANSTQAVEVSRVYNILTGSGEPVSIKSYDPRLIFSPNSENWMDAESGQLYENESQANTNTIFVPNNQTVDAYVKNMLLQYFPENQQDVGLLPVNIVADFVSAHMWSVPVWPTRFETTRNSFGDPARFDPETEVTEKAVLSNAFFYGTNKVLESNVFHSVYGRAYLDPNYSVMVDYLGIQAKKVFTQKDNFYTFFLISNDAIRDAGFSYDTQNNHWQYVPPGGGATLTGQNAVLRLDRMIYQHITLVNEIDELADLSGEGIVRTYGEEYIKYKDGKVFTAGNLDAGEEVEIMEGPIYTDNGIVYLLDGILEVSDKSVTEHLKENFEDSFFWQYLVNSTAYVNQNIDGTSLGSPYTVLVPTDEAISAAVEAGLLPGTAGVPNFTPGSSIDKALVDNFIKYHVIINQVIVDEGEDLADISYQTLYKDLEGETGLVRVSDGNNGITEAQDMLGGSAEIIRGDKSNILSNWAVIHQIDGYLDYRR